MSHIMIRFILISIVMSLFSCCTNAPQCNNEKVKIAAVDKFNEEIKPVIIENWVEENLSYSDIREYAWDRDLNPNELIEKEKKRLTKFYDSIAHAGLKITKIENIRTIDIDEEINKCTCEAEIDNPNLNPATLHYTAQRTEDNDNYWVQIDIEFKVKK